MQQWEYLTLFIEASKDVSMEYTTESETLAKFSPQTMMPEMDRLGAKGWELVHMQPAYVGKNDDILIHEGGGIRQWTSKYFCVFKRPT